MFQENTIFFSVKKKCRHFLRAQPASAVEYTDWYTAEGKTPRHQKSVLNNLMAKP